MTRAASLAHVTPERVTVLATATLASVGLVVIYSATAPLSLGKPIPPHFLRHAGALGLGLACAVAVQRIPLSVWRRAALPLWGASLAALAATLAVGVRVHGAKRWLLFPAADLSFQPGELAKWATLLAMAAVLGRPSASSRHLRREVPLAIVLAALPAALLLLQPDTGNAVLLLGLAALMLFVAGVPLRRFAIPGLLGAAALSATLALRPYALSRWRAFQDPWAMAEGPGFQLVQSFVAFGRGGALGVGLGDGRQKLFYLPAAHTDFVLAVIAEELGLVGVGLVLVAFVTLLLAGCRIAARARDRFALLTAFAMTALIAVSAWFNAAVVMGVVPPKGLTLPFVSYGGTSLLVCLLAVGILLRLARHEACAAPRMSLAARWPWRWAR